jgi:hypothetical protein
VYRKLKNLLGGLLTPWRHTPFYPEDYEAMEDIYQQGKQAQNSPGAKFGVRYGKVQAGPDLFRPKGGKRSASAPPADGPTPPENSEE